MANTPKDTNDPEEIRRSIAELEAKLTRMQGATAGREDQSKAGSSKSINTQGGAAVEGSVEVANGHFIGRDFIQIVTKTVQAGDDPEEAKSVIALYLQALATDLAGLKLGEIDASPDQTRVTPLQLADVYVPLNTHLWIAVEDTLARWLSSRHEPQRDTETRAVSALEALTTHHKLTIIGKPGSGKSTFGASVLMTLAQVWQGHNDELPKLGDTWKHGALLPIRVILRRFAEQLPPGDKPARAGDLWDFIARDLNASGYGLSAETIKFVQRIARNHGALIFLDGLDECGNDASRQRVLSAVNEFMNSAGPKCRFLLTARPYAWPDGPNPANGVYTLSDLNDEQIEQFIRAWYAALVKRKWRSPGEAELKLQDLLAARQRPDLLPLAQNPLLLTLMATLHTNRGRLPDDRADLYHESVELLLLRWNRQIGADKALLDQLDVPGLKLSELREVLEELAFKIHEENIDVEGTADVGEDRLVRAFRPLLNNSKDKADIVVDYIEKRAGLLIAQGELDGQRQFSFPHRTFQEVLAACHLVAQDDFPAECARLARAAPGHWRVALPLAARLAKTERGASAADELIGGVSIEQFRANKAPEAADWTCALLAGMQLLEVGMGGLNKRDRTRAIVARVAGWLAASLPIHPSDDGMSSEDRAHAGDLLGALGDPRFDPQRFHLPADAMQGFVHIPADPDFMIGTRKRDAKRVAKVIDYKVDENEINDALTPAPEFYMGRYLVTVAQFRAFVEATDFVGVNADALRDPDSRPVRYVNWHDALAYCDWLNTQFATSPALADSDVARLVRERQWRVTLPSELEWEKAARGNVRDKIFPWGDEPDTKCANYAGTGIGTTSAVGCFPENGLGLLDMIGNVWERTRSRLEPYPYEIDDGREELESNKEEWRVVRGGGFLFHLGYARCAARLRFHPGNRHGSFGFRVVLRSPPVV